MSEALRALLDFAFSTLRLHRIEADVDPRNLPSVRLLERLGFRREGLLRERWQVNGEIQDALFLGLLAPEWRPREGDAPAQRGEERGSGGGSSGASTSRCQ